MKALVNFMCCFVPSKKKRKEIRRHKKLLDYSCIIEGDVAFTKEQIRFDISDYAKVCAQIG